MLFNIRQLLDKAADVDPDLRYMALNDIQQLLLTAPEQLARSDALSIEETLFRGLEDTNLDILNQAVGCFPPYTQYLENHGVVEVVQRLAAKPRASHITVSILTMALKAVLANLVVAPATARTILDTVLALVGPAEAAAKLLDLMELLSDAVTHLGDQLQTADFASVTKTIVTVARTGDGAIALKAVHTLGVLASKASAAQLKQIVEVVTAPAPSKNPTTRLQLVCALGSLTADIGPYAPQLFHLAFTDLRADTIDVLFQDADEQAQVDTVRAAAFQAIELVARKAPSVPRDVLDVCVLFLAYDPYLANDPDLQMDGVDDDDDDFVYLDDEYVQEDEGDDLDVSWRLRRAAAHAAAVAITASPAELLDDGVARVVPALTTAVADAVDTVAQEAVAALTTIVALVDRHLHAREQLAALAPLVVHRVTTVLLVPAKQTLFQPALVLLLTLLQTLLGLGSALDVSLVLQAINSVRTATGALASLQELLKFYSVLVRTNPPQVVFDNNNDHGVVAGVTQGLQAQAHGLVVEALKTLLDVLLASASTGVDISPLASAIVEKASTRLYLGPLRSLALGALVDWASTRQLEPLQLETVLGLVLECLVVELVAAAAVVGAGRLVGLVEVPLPWLHHTLTLLLGYIASTHATAGLPKHRVLETLPVIVDNSRTPVPVELRVEILQALAAGGGDLETRDLNAYLRVATSVLLEPVPAALVENAVVLIKQALQALFPELVDAPALDGVVMAVAKQVGGAQLRQVVAQQFDANQRLVLRVLAVCVGSDALLQGEVASAVALVNSANATPYALQFVAFVLRYYAAEVTPASFLAHLDSTAADLRTAAAQLLGFFVALDLPHRLPVVVQQLDAQQSPARATLVLMALKEALVAAGGADAASTQTIWNAVVQFTLTIAGDKASGDGAKVAGECFALAGQVAPQRVAQLGELLAGNSTAPATQFAVVSAFKKLCGGGHVNAELTAVLGPLLLPVLRALELLALEVKRAVLDTLVLTLHTHPAMVEPVIAEVLPLVYAELDKRREYIRVIQMGPRKHEIDDGAGVRRLAYEFLGAAVASTTFPQLVNVGEMFDLVVAKGIKDDYDVLPACCDTLVVLVEAHPAVLGREDTVAALVAGFSKITSKTLPDLALKQIVEAQEGAVRNTDRAIEAIEAVVEAGDVVALSAKRVRDYAQQRRQQEEERLRRE